MAYDERRFARQAGIDIYLTKPVRRARLHAALAEVLGLRERREHVVARARDGADAAGAPILVAEDNEVNQILTLRLLERRGYRAEVVGAGRAAATAR